jgi:hypothetical protein
MRAPLTPVWLATSPLGKSSPPLPPFPPRRRLLAEQARLHRAQAGTGRALVCRERGASAPDADTHHRPARGEWALHPALALAYRQQQGSPSVPPDQFPTAAPASRIA